MPSEDHNLFKIYINLDPSFLLEAFEKVTSILKNYLRTHTQKKKKRKEKSLLNIWSLTAILFEEMKLVVGRKLEMMEIWSSNSISTHEAYRHCHSCP